MTLTIEGAVGGPFSELTVLTVAPDGSIQIPKIDKVATQDASLLDVVEALNRSTELITGGNGARRDGWNASLTLPDVHGTGSPVVVPVVVANATGSDFDFHGVGQFMVQPPTQQNSGGPQRGGFRHGGFRGGGFPGGNSGGGAQSAGDSGEGAGGGRDAGSLPSREELSIAVSVDGRVRHGTVSKILIVETRSISVEALPYTNVSSWTIEASK
jgi:hypothetical protein